MKEKNLIKPAEFDVLFNHNNEECKVVTPYVITNYLFGATMLQDPSQDDIMARRFALKKVFEERVKFLLSTVFIALENDISRVLRELFKEKNQTKYQEYIPRNYHSRFYYNKHGSEYVYDLFSYTGFNNIITKNSYLDIISIILNDAYNDFVICQSEVIDNLGFDALNAFVPCFKDFHKKLLYIFETILKEVENIYGPAGYNEFNSDSDRAVMLTEMSEKTDKRVY